MSGEHKMNRATQIVHWPGKDVPACEEHVQKFMGLANVMGFALSCTPCADAIFCTNCLNEQDASKAWQWS